MGLTVITKQRKLFHKRNVDVEGLISKFRFRYGTLNAFNILEEGVVKDSSVTVYNPSAIARGIYISWKNMASEGEVEIGINIPTSVREIMDFLSIVYEVSKQLDGPYFYCIENEVNYTFEQLYAEKDKIIRFSLDALKNFCRDNDYEEHILTLARWPISLETDDMNLFARETNLNAFANIIHNLQNKNIYYAKPSLYQNTINNTMVAKYGLTEGMPGIYPIKYDGFFNVNDMKVSAGFINFYLKNSQAPLDVTLDYNKFAQNPQITGAIKYDATHILVPALTAANIDNIINILS